MKKQHNIPVKTQPASPTSTALKTLRASAILKPSKSKPLRTLDLNISLKYRR